MGVFFYEFIDSDVSWTDIGSQLIPIATSLI